MRTFAITLALGFAFALPVAAGLRAGVATIDVTPEKFPVIVNGMFTSRTATAALDRLHARALVLDDGSTKLAIVVVDSCMMPREFLDKVKEEASKPSGIPVDRMLISATHTHSAPAVMGCLGTDPDPVYPAFLHAQLVRAITQAAKATVPARAGWAVTHAPNHTFNRRWILRSDRVKTDPFGDPTVRANMHPGYQNPDFIGPSGPVDDALSLLALQTADGKPLAVLANFSMHYFGSGIVSADYFGLFCEKLAKRIDAKSPPWVAMSQGTSGDLMWMDYGKPKSDMTIDRYADELAAIALAAYGKIKYSEDTPLKMKETKLTLNRRVPDAKRLEWARKVIAGVKDGKVQSQQEIYAREAIYLHEEPKRELKLQVIGVGDFGIFTIPNEVFATTGIGLKALAPFAASCVIELANGAEGYIPPLEQHALGGYTTWPARTAGLEVLSEARILGVLFGMARQMGNTPRRSTPEPEYAQEIRRSSPLVSWRFEPYGGNVPDDLDLDILGRYEPGIAIGLPSQWGRCVQFAGGRMKANLKDLGSIYTVELRFWNGFPNDARPVTGYLFSRGTDGDKQANGDHLAIGGTHSHAGKLVFFNGDVKKQALAGTTVIEPKTWHHVALVRDGTKVRVYLDGKEEIAGEADVTVPAGVGQVFFGGRNDRFAGFEGKLDEAAIYNRALPADEIAKHVAAAK